VGNVYACAGRNDLRCAVENVKAALYPGTPFEQHLSTGIQYRTQCSIKVTSVWSVVVE